MGTTVNGITNTILRNNSSQSLTLQNTQGGGNQTMAVSLGNATENKVVIDGSGTIAISSVVKSDSGTTPLTVTGSGSGRFDVTNTANTFTGTISLMGSEVRFSSANSYGNANNTIVIDGGRLATASSTTYTLASTHGIQVSAAEGNSINVVTSGTLSYDGIIADKAGATGVLAKQGAGTLALGGASTYTGTTTISEGTLDVGGAGSLKTSSVAINSGGTLLLSGTGGTNNKLTATAAPSVALNGGTLNTGGLNNLDQTVGALSLTANSVIDFASLASGSQSLRFAASNADWTGLTLSVWNWTAGVDHLYFGTNSNGLTGGQLSQVSFYGGSGTGFLGTAGIDSSGELSPIPEPSTVFALVGLFGVIGWRERKRLRRVLALAGNARTGLSS